MKSLIIAAVLFGTSASALPLDRHTCIAALSATVIGSKKTADDFATQIKFLQQNYLPEVAAEAEKAKTAALDGWKLYEDALVEHCKPQF